MREKEGPSKARTASEGAIREKSRCCNPGEPTVHSHQFSSEVVKRQQSLQKFVRGFRNQSNRGVLKQEAREKKSARKKKNQASSRGNMSIQTENLSPIKHK